MSVLAVLAATRNKDRCTRPAKDKRSEGQPTTGKTSFGKLLAAIRVLLNESIRHHEAVLSVSGHN